jgi:beta-galactosidase
VETRRTWFDGQGLVVGDGGERRLPFYAGAMHYWRVEPARWPACLRAMHDLGFTIVETYVPWREHEVEPGEYEWTGRRDLATFCAAAQAAGLAVVIRPGPHCNAELTAFGFPDHVIADPACQARTARDTPVWMPSPPRAWPVPSYASAAFRERVRGWYAEVAAQVKDLLAPGGPIVAIGVDNEAQMFFRLGAYDHDYHPDAIAWFEELGYDDAPRAWEDDDAERCAAWVRFKDHYIARSLGELAKLLDDVGFAGLARFHNLPPGHHGLYDLPAIQRAIGGPVGIDAYTGRDGFRELRRRGLALAGQADPVPLALEVGVGFFPWMTPLDPEDDPHRERDHLLTLLAAGARGFNLYMAVERERWYGAAISSTGTVEKHASWIAPLIRALDEVDWPALRRAPAIALVDTRADARFGLATSAADPLTPVLSEVLGLGPAGAAELGTDAGAIVARHWQTAIASALEMAQVPYVIVSESATEAELARYRAVIAPTPGRRIDRALWGKLRALAEAKRTVVVIGPGTPTEDELDRPLGDPPPRRVGRLKDGSRDDLAGLAVDLGALVERDDDVQTRWTMERPEWVRVYAYADAGGTVRVVFAINDRDMPAVGSLYSDVSLRDPFNHERCVSTDGKVSIGLPPRGVRMLISESR